MVHYGRSTSCTDAELYYYECLCGQGEGAIPPAVIEHIRQCTYCRKRIRELESALGEGQTRADQALQTADVVDTLTRHFAHVGQDVGCTDVKAFLPAMLIASQKIVIPTPITVHLDHCLECAEDLHSLRDLALRPEQLARLGKLYGASRNEDLAMCRRAGPHIHAFACLAFENIDAEVLDHICTCPSCLRRVYGRRDRMLVRGQSQTASTAGVPCDSISMAGLFGWVVPYGHTGMPSGQASMSDEELVAHVRACPRCLERVQILHHTVYGIAERTDSGVSTVYTTGRETQQPPRQAADPYGSYPIQVELAHRQVQPAVRLRPATRVGTAARRVVTHPQFKHVLRASAVAAVVLLAFGYFFNPQTVSGLSLRHLSGALKAVDNLHVRNYSGDGTRLLSEMWVSQADGLVVVKNYGDYAKDAVYDLREGRSAVRRAGTVERGRLSPEERGLIQGNVDSLLKLAEDTPVDAELQPLPTGAAERVEAGGEVRELLWTGKTTGGPSPLCKLLVYLDSTKRLPVRTELYRQLPGEEEQRAGVSEFEPVSRQAVDSAVAQVLNAR